MSKSQIPEVFTRAMCRRLKEARAAAGYTQRTFAERINLEEKTYAKYESRTPLPHNLIGPVCRILGLDAMWLLEGVGADAEPGPKLKRMK